MNKSILIAVLVVLLSVSNVFAGCGGGCGGSGSGGCGCSGADGCSGGCGAGCKEHSGPAQAALEARKAKFAADNQTIAKAEKIGNTVCPTCGDKLDLESAYPIYHKGKIINLCCADCLEEFEKNSDSYTQKAIDSKTQIPSSKSQTNPNTK